MTAFSVGIRFPRRDDLDLVRSGDEAGYDRLWAAEGQGLTAFGKLERWAQVTDDVCLGTGIVNVFSRSPAAIAQSVATLDRHADGRAMLGLGVAHPGVVEAFHGTEFDRPLSRMAEYIELVRRYLHGPDGAFDGDFFSPERTRLWDNATPVQDRIPIYNAALGPDNVRLTGKHADGWLPYLYPHKTYIDRREALEESARAASRDPEAIDRAMYVLAAASPDVESACDAVTTHIAASLRDVPGYYDRIARQAGFGDDVDAIREASTTTEATTRMSSDFVESLAIITTPDKADNYLESLREDGVTHPIIHLPAGASPSLVETTIDAFAST